MGNNILKIQPIWRKLCPPDYSVIAAILSAEPRKQPRFLSLQTLNLTKPFPIFTKFGTGYTSTIPKLFPKDPWKRIKGLAGIADLVKRQVLGKKRKKLKNDLLVANLHIWNELGHNLHVLASLKHQKKWGNLVGKAKHQKPLRITQNSN